MNNVRILCLVALCAAVTIPFVSIRAQAQDPFAACLTACDAHVNAASESEEEAAPMTIGQVIAQCRTLPACAAIDRAEMDRVGRICEGAATRSRRRGSGSTTTPLAACVLPDGSVESDEGRRRCRCPSGTFPIPAASHRSADRLRSLEIPRGHAVFVCYNPLAPRGAPGSAEERSETLASTVEAHDAALRALCAPGEGEELTAACTRARQEFLAAGPTDGTVDLSRVLRALEGLREAVAAQQATVDTLVDRSASHERSIMGHTEMISALSRNVGFIVQCLSRGRDGTISYTVHDYEGMEDPEHRTETYSCGDLLDAVRQDVLDEARRVAREEASRAGGSRSDNFAMLSAYGLVTFNPLRYANADRGSLYGIGAELSVGIGLGGGWNIHGGIALGYGGPDLPDVTNVQGAGRLGFGAWVDPGIMIGFGMLGTHRFRPDVFSVHSVYGPYLDATFRFFPREEWTPVATIRGFVGASPRYNGAAWHVEADGGVMALIGIAHF
ncbi:hypothetical protein EDM68_04090 [Candidatus Uhrbacteria bacterium]|nr:MAG: hypothetical protein EDM68_04090 [Candidatus Uhrbacteria bacterium]